MSVHAGPADWWTDGTDAGRTHIATKGIVTSGLVLNLDAGVSSSYPGTGTTWTDLSGNSNNASLVNGPGFSSSNGGCITFDATDDYISVSDSSSLDITGNNITLQVTYKSNDLSSGIHGDGLLSKGSGGNDGVYELLLSPSGSLNSIFFRCASLGFHNPKIITMAVGNIFIVHGVLRQGRMITYVNGVAEDAGFQTSGNISVSNQPLTLSTRQFNEGSSTSALNGTIYEAKVYNRALSDAEIRQNFNALRGRFGL